MTKSTLIITLFIAIALGFSLAYLDRTKTDQNQHTINPKSLTGIPNGARLIKQYGTANTNYDLSLTLWELDGMCFISRNLHKYSGALLTHTKCPDDLNNDSINKYPVIINDQITK